MSDQNCKKNLTLITGGARAGKSELAESLANEHGSTVHYLATMRRWPDDREGAERIERHRQRRPAGWKTIEVDLGLDRAVKDLPAGPGCVLIDCLSVYVSNLLLAGYCDQENPFDRQPVIVESIDNLLDAIGSRQDLDFLTVTNEVGWGVIPQTILGRAYRDLLGIANKTFAREAASVWLMCSGLKLKLK